MTNDMRDWLSFVMSAVLFLLPLIKAFWAKPRRRVRRIERFRSFRVWGVELTTYDREEDDQS